LDKELELLEPFLDEFEGYSEEVYPDQKNNPTVGYGFNLNAGDTAGLLKLHGYDPEALKSKKLKMKQEDAKTIRRNIINKKADNLKQTIGEDLYNTLDSNKKAGLLSLMYNAPALIGPKLIQGLSTDDGDLSLLSEVVSNSNKNKDAGVLYRRLREAELMSPKSFPNVFQAMTKDQLYSLKKMGEKHPQIVEKYGIQLGIKPSPLGLDNLFKLFKKNKL